MPEQKVIEGFEQPLAVRGPEPEAALLPWQASGGMAVVSTIADPKDTLRAMADTVDLSEALDRAFKLVHITVHKATIAQEDGTELPVRRTVLTDNKGVNYACVSEGIIASVQQLAAVFGDPPWPEGIAVKAIQKNTRRGFRVYRLVPA